MSSNPVAVRTLQNLGVENSFQFMEEKFHIDLEDGRTVNGQVMNDLGASQLALGGLTDGVSVVDMAAAYSVFPRNGLYVEPRTYTKVTRVLDDGTEEVLLDNTRISRGGSLRGDHLVYQRHAEKCGYREIRRGNRHRGPALRYDGGRQDRHHQLQ